MSADGATLGSIKNMALTWSVVRSKIVSIYAI
jgi:hypothetical protein